MQMCLQINILSFAVWWAQSSCLCGTLILKFNDQSFQWGSHCTKTRMFGLQQWLPPLKWGVWSLLTAADTSCVAQAVSPFGTVGLHVSCQSKLRRPWVRHKTNGMKMLSKIALTWRSPSAYTNWANLKRFHLSLLIRILLWDVLIRKVFCCLAFSWFY